MGAFVHLRLANSPQYTPRETSKTGNIQMRIVQISDLHIGEKGDDSPVSVKMLANVVKTITHINQLDPQPDLVVINGNITSNGTIEASMNAREVLDALNCPYKLVPGPNDERQNLFGTFADKATANEVGGVLSYLVEGFPMRLIGLDSLGHHGVGGRVCPKRLNWLNTHLSSDTSVPTIIFTHHVPMKTGAAAADADGFENGENLGAVVAQYSNINRILCGHINLATHTAWQGTIVTSAPSMGMPSGLEEGEAPAPAYHLHQMGEHGDLVTRTVFVE